MRVARSLIVVVSMMLVTASGASAAKKHGHSSVRVNKPSLQEFLKKLSGPEGDSLDCIIYCDGTNSPPTITTNPGTVSGCLADCAEICGSPCEIVN